jgi:hypothetical protein
MVMRPTLAERIGIVTLPGGFIVFFAAQFIVGAAWSNLPVHLVSEQCQRPGNA